MLEAQKAEIEENMRRQYGDLPPTPRTGTATGEDVGSHGGRYDEWAEEPSYTEDEPMKVRCSYKDFNGCYPPTYNGASDPIVLHNWVNEMEMVFTACQCLDNQRTGFAVTKLKGDALQWWIDYQGTHGRRVIDRMSWEEFLEELKERFCTIEEIRSLEKEFLGFKKGSMTINDYNSKFLKLMSFSRRLVPDEGAKVAQYVDGLPYQVQMSMGEPTTLQHAMRRAIKLVKTTEAHEKSKGGDASNKRKFEGSSKGKEKYDPKKNKGLERSKSLDEKTNLSEVVCFKCGESGHYANKCTKPIKCFDCGEEGHLSFNCPKKKDGGGKQVKKDNPKAKGRAFQMTAEQARDEADVVSGTFLVNSIAATLLIDTGATYSFVSKEFGKKMNIPPSRLKTRLEVEIADGKVLTISNEYTNVPVILGGVTFMSNLFPTQLGGFDVILGMDWLGRYEAEILCGKKMLKVKSPEGEPIVIYGEKKKLGSSVINIIKARKSMMKGCQAFLAYVIDATKEKKEAKDIEVVRDFLEVFPDDLPGVPPERQVEFWIDLVPGTVPIAKAPHPRS